MTHRTIGSAPHSTSRTAITDSPSPESHQPQFDAGYNVGWRHGVLDALALTDIERATLLRQVSPTKE